MLLKLIVALTLPLFAIAACSLCEDGSVPKFLSKPIGITSPFPVVECRELGQAVSFLREDSSLCSDAKLIASYCGCPTPPGACKMCVASNGTIRNPDLPIDVLAVIPSQAEALVSTMAPRPSITCDLYDSLLNANSNSSDVCLNQTEGYLIARVCGCFEELPLNDSAPDIDGNDTNVTDTNQTCPFCAGNVLENVGDDGIAGIGEVIDPCTVCAEGEPVGYPDLKLDDITKDIIPVSVSWL